MPLLPAHGHFAGGVPFVPPTVTQSSAILLGQDNNLEQAPANRALDLPSGATLVPAVGTNWFGLFFVRTNDTPVTSVSDDEVIGTNSTIFTGGSSSGIWTNWGTGTGLLGVRKQIGSVNWWTGTNPTALTMAEFTEYLVCFGQIGTLPFVALAKCKGTVADVQKVVGTTNQAATNSYYYDGTGTARTQTDFVTRLGSFTGSATNREGWGGSIGEVVWATGAAFPNSGGTPDSQTLADLASGALDIPTWLTSLGATKRYHLKPSPTNLAPESGSTVTGSATLVGTGHREGTAVLQRPSLRLDALGDGYVFPVMPGASSGKVWFSGTYSGGPPSAMQGRVIDATTLSPVSGGDWQDLAGATLSGGSYSGYIANVPAGGPYYREVRWKNYTTCAISGRDHIGVGIVALLVGQSQLVFLIDNSTSTGTGATLAPSLGSVFASVCTQLSYGNASGGVNVEKPSSGGHASVRKIISTGDYGDGIVAAANRLTALSGWPVMFVLVAHGNTPLRGFAYDRQVATAQVGTGNGSTTAFSGTLAPPSATYPVGQTWVNQAQPSSLTFTAGGVTATDDGAGNLTGTGVASGTINYQTGAWTLTFSAAPANATAINVSWQMLNDVAGTSYTANSPLTGQSLWGTTPANGQALQALSRMPFGASLAFVDQGTATSVDFASTYTQPKADWLQMFTVLKQRVQALPNCSGLRHALATHSREQASSADTRLHRQRQAHYEIGQAAADTCFGGVRTDIALISNAGPHEDTTDQGGRRYGAAVALGVWAAMQDAVLVRSPTLVRGPEVVSAAFTDGTRVAIDVTFNLFGTATQLVTYSGATTGLAGWRVGADAGSLASTGFTAAIQSATVVRLTKSSGSWTAGSVIDYLFGYPFISGSGQTQDLADMGTHLYDDRAGLAGAYRPGVPALPVFSPLTVAG